MILCGVPFALQQKFSHFKCSRALLSFLQSLFLACFHQLNIPCGSFSLRHSHLLNVQSFSDKIRKIQQHTKYANPKKGVVFPLKKRRIKYYLSGSLQFLFSFSDSGLKRFCKGINRCCNHVIRRIFPQKKTAVRKTLDRRILITIKYFSVYFEAHKKALNHSAVMPSVVRSPVHVGWFKKTDAKSQKALDHWQNR